MQAYLVCVFFALVISYLAVVFSGYRQIERVESVGQTPHSVPRADSAVRSSSRSSSAGATQSAFANNSISDSQRVHIITPVFNRTPWVKGMLESLVSTGDKNWIAHVVDFSSDDLRSERDVEALKRAANFHLDFVRVASPLFSKGHGLNVAFSRVPKNELCAIVDADIRVPRAYFQIVRRMVVPGKRAVVFSVQRLAKNGTLLRVDNYSPGIIAFAAQDGELIGGLARGAFANSTRWGGEDTSIVQRLEAAQVHVHRFDGSMDPKSDEHMLEHVFHPHTGSFYEGVMGPWTWREE